MGSAITLVSQRHDTGQMQVTGVPMELRGVWLCPGAPFSKPQTDGEAVSLWMQSR